MMGNFERSASGVELCFSHSKSDQVALELPPRASPRAPWAPSLPPHRWSSRQGRRLLGWRWAFLAGMGWEGAPGGPFPAGGRRAAVPSVARRWAAGRRRWEPSDGAGEESAPHHVQGNHFMFYL